MNKRVHEIAKERGLPAKEVLAKLKAAGIEVKAVSSSVDESVALSALGNGDSKPAPVPAKPAPAAEAAAATQTTSAAPTQSAAPTDSTVPAPAQPSTDGDQPRPPAAAAGERPATRSEHKRPTRDSLQGERAPGSAQGRRRVVIDSQASRRAPGSAPPQANQPPRRQRRGRRRRGVYDEEAESRPAARTALAEPDAIQINSGSTVKDVAEYLDVPVPEVMKKLMA